jgi:diguanylate cyclase (GGDEF)-like protein
MSSPALAYIARVKWHRSVQLRVLVGLLVLGLLWLLVVTISKHALSVSEERAALPARAQSLADAYRESLSLSVWRFDEQQALRLLSGIQSAPDVHSAWISADTETADRSVWVRTGAVGGSSDPEFRFELHNPDERAELIGKLHIQFDAKRIQARVRRSIAELAFAQLLTVLALSIGTLWVVRRSVINDLQNLSARVSSFEPMNADSSFQIRDRAQVRGDEIDQVVGALEQMRVELRGSYQALADDVERQKAAEQKAAYQARHDTLTGLPNRLNLEEELMVRIATSNDRAGAIAFVDVDHFKILNDARGHAFGDAVLVAFAKSLQGRLQANEIMARFGGDEFIVLLNLDPSLPELDAAQAAAERLRKAASVALDVEGQALTLGLSVGVAVYPRHGSDIDTLVANADAAMYHSKQAGRNLATVFSDAMRSAAENHLALETAIREALDQRQFAVAFQPLFAAHDRSLIGAEALIRWQHPQLGAVSPATFIPICEQSGLIREVGEAVLDLSLQQLADWQALRLWPDDATLSINISMRQLNAHQFAENFLAKLKAHGLHARSISLELTESVMMFDVEATCALMAKLQAAGIRFAIDDFGTGFSSLAYLSRLPASGLKIDRSFISDIGRVRGGEAIVEAIIDMAKHLELAVIGEGVETEAQANFLKQRGCLGIQGYLLGRPVFAAEFSQRYLSPD